MVAKMRFWFSEKSMSITKASFNIGYDIEICVTVFLINYQAMFTRKATPTHQLNGHF